MCVAHLSVGFDGADRKKNWRIYLSICHVSTLCHGWRLNSAYIGQDHHEKDEQDGGAAADFPHGGISTVTHIFKCAPETA